MFRRRSSMGSFACVAAAAAVMGAVGYAIMNEHCNMRAMRRKAVKTIGKISDKVIDNIHSMM